MELDDAYGQTFDRLRRMFRARGCSPEEAADLAQDAAVRAFMHIRRWGVTGAGLDPLLNRIARNLLIDRYRRVTPHVVPLDSADEIQDPAQDPSEEVARRQRRSAVHSAIRALPSRHQKAITYSMSGLSPEEVGKELGIGRNAADALLHRARRSLREHLAPVRDGMWGVALIIRVRWDRLTRRAGVDPARADGAQVSALGSTLSVASVAVAAVLAVTGFAGPQGPHETRAPARPSVATAEMSSPAAASDGSVAAPTIGGPNSPGSTGGHVYRLGPAMRSTDSTGTTTTVTGPSDPNGNPLFRLSDRNYGSKTPHPDDPVGSSLGPALDRFCGLSRPLCPEW